MAPAPDITNIPAPRVAFIDPRTGLMAREWYLFFLRLFINSGGSSNLNLAALQMAPQDSDYGAAQMAAEQAAQTQPQHNDALATLAQQVHDLAVAPAVQPEVQQLHYGAFFDTTDQTAALINTPYAVTFNSVDGVFGVRRGSPTSRIIVDNPGVYNFQFSIQIDKISGGAGLIYIWARINGNDVADSMSRHRVKDNDAEDVLAWNFLLTLKGGDYFELMWAVDNVDIILEATAAAAFGPATPSVILTVTKVNL